MSKINPEQIQNNEDTQPSSSRATRTPLPVSIEFIGDFDIVEAHGINISEGGVCFELQTALPFEMRFKHQNEIQEKRCQLMWAKQLSNGNFQLGFMFIPPKAYPKI